MVIGVPLTAVAILEDAKADCTSSVKGANRVRVKRLRQIIVVESSGAEAGELVTMQLEPDQVLRNAPRFLTRIREWEIEN